MVQIETRSRPILLALMISLSPVLTGCAQFFSLLGLDGSAFNALPAQSFNPSPPEPLSCDPEFENSYGGGDGSVDKPYTICSLKQWEHFGLQSADWDKNFLLEADLDFTGVLLADFKMIGTAVTPFRGTFNGGGHRIQNVTIAGAAVPVAIFLQTDGGAEGPADKAEIKNIILENVAIETTSRGAVLVLDHEANGTLSLTGIQILTGSLTSTLASAGVLVGSAESDVEISDLVASDLAVNLNAGTSGGIVGYAQGALVVEDVQINNLSVIGSFMSTNYSGGFAGTILGAGSLFRNVVITGLTLDAGWASSGVVGRAWGLIDFERVRVAGTVEAGGGQSGIIGEAAAISIVECSFTGTLVNAGNTSYGGLAGVLFDDAVIQRSYFSGQASVWSGVFGGLVGNAAYAGKSLLIEDSYAVGNRVTTHATQGVMSGLIGHTATGGDIIVRRSFYAGSYSGTATPKRSCVMGFTTSNSLLVEDVYFDSTVCTHPADHDTVIAGTSGVPTATLQSAAPLMNWDPTVWEFAGGQYPKLVWQD